MDFYGIRKTDPRIFIAGAGMDFDIQNAQLVVDILPLQMRIDDFNPLIFLTGGITITAAAFFFYAAINTALYI
jgi:hypothetical protein